MSLVIFGLILNMFGSVLNTYISDLMPIIIHIFTPISFPQLLIVFLALALYPHGATEAFVFVVPYANVFNISDFYQTHFISINFLHHIGILTCDSHHNFPAIQGI